MFAITQVLRSCELVKVPPLTPLRAGSSTSGRQRLPAGLLKESDIWVKGKLTKDNLETERGEWRMSCLSYSMDG